MNILALLQARFSTALESLVPDADKRAELVEMVRPSQDAKFGDYQANCAMPMKNLLGQPPREIAQQIVEQLRIDDLCEPPEIAGPGFINLKLRDAWLTEQLRTALADPARLGIAPVAEPRTYIIDYSSPNVAKPMHVGHIRSTVIGDALYNLLKFLGHKTISDNHIGDWGTQFGMIIYGYKNFRDDAAYRANPVPELSRLYRLVNRIIDFNELGSKGLPELKAELSKQAALLAEPAEAVPAGDKNAEKKATKERRKLEARVAELTKTLAEAEEKLAKSAADAEFVALAHRHAQAGEAALAETARLHEGDAENLKLWHEFLPPCLQEIQKTYRRLNVSFDYALGESFYHDKLAGVVEDLEKRGLAKESDGAMCIFLPGIPAPMIVRKKDGAFLYATTDLATIRYRMQEFQPDAILYVVDHRQSMHFDQLFAVTKLWGYEKLELVHVSFGTVLGEDGRPYKTRSGDSVGLESLLDEAVNRALLVVTENDERKKNGPELSTAERQRVAEAVGIGALKYADLVQNRTTDYTFSYDKMLGMNGNTATYMQYAHARVRGIIAKAEIAASELQQASSQFAFTEPAERALGLEILRFSEALQVAAGSYQPHPIALHLFEIGNRFSTFYDQCPVVKADAPEVRLNRLLLCELTARTLRLGLNLLGIEVVEKM
jgi:arginyl-tRNA synthetase